MKTSIRSDLPFAKTRDARVLNIVGVQRFQQRGPSSANQMNKAAAA